MCPKSLPTIAWRRLTVQTPPRIASARVSPRGINRSGTARSRSIYAQRRKLAPVQSPAALEAAPAYDPLVPQTRQLRYQKLWPPLHGCLFSVPAPVHAVTPKCIGGTLRHARLIRIEYEERKQQGLEWERPASRRSRKDSTAREAEERLRNLEKCIANWQKSGQIRHSEPSRTDHRREKCGHVPSRHRSR